jgi:hypothetical protein
MRKFALLLTASLFLLSLVACVQAEQRPCPPPQPCPTAAPCLQDLPPPLNEPEPASPIGAPAGPVYQPAPCDSEDDWPSSRVDAESEYYPGRPLDCRHYAPADVEQAIRRMHENDAFIPEYLRDAEPGKQLLAIHALDPVGTALHLAGYPNPDGLSPDRVSIFYKNSSEATVVVAQYGMMDDSVTDLEQRVDLRREEDGWVVEWMGYRQRCARAAPDAWMVDLCP